MADEKTNPNKAAQPASVKSRLAPILIVVLLMGAEGVGVFLLAKAITPNPVPAQAAGIGGDGQVVGPNDDEYAEVELADCRPSNKTSGKFITFHVRVSALVLSTDLQQVEKLAKDKRARLEDGVNTIIRSAELNHLNEPGLETVKRRLKHEFNRIFDDDQLVKEVLIPHFLQSGSGV